LIIDDFGLVKNKFKSLPFGQEIENTGIKFSFATGKELDDSGLYYFGARYYDSDLGRFISVDPVPSEPAYQYVSNNPLNLVDLNGNEPSVYNSQTGNKFPNPISINDLGTKSFNTQLYIFDEFIEYKGGALSEGITLNIGAEGNNARVSTNTINLKSNAHPSAFAHEFEHLRTAGTRGALREGLAFKEGGLFTQHLNKKYKTNLHINSAERAAMNGPNSFFNWYTDKSPYLKGYPEHSPWNAAKELGQSRLFNLPRIARATAFQKLSSTSYKGAASILGASSKLLGVAVVATAMGSSGFSVGNLNDKILQFQPDQMKLNSCMRCHSFQAVENQEQYGGWSNKY
jgi:RHS repeat-associated protein